jgi:hypothetical protein
MVTFFESPTTELFLIIKIFTNPHGFCQSLIQHQRNKKTPLRSDLQADSIDLAE